MSWIVKFKHFEQIFSHSSLITFVGCPPEDVTVVSGDRYDSNYPVEALLIQDKKETCCPATYWLGQNSQLAAFILDLGCRHTVKGIKLVNSHNRHGKDRATKQFK